MRRRLAGLVPVGGKVRATFKLVEVRDIPGGAQTKIEATLEREGGDKPVCVAETLARVYAAPDPD